MAQMADLIHGRASWLDARTGKLTASRMGMAMSYKKDGSSSAERVNLMMQLCAERMTGDATRNFVSDAMQWGLDHEQAAKEAYTKRTGVEVEQCFFFDHSEIEWFGATPDGLLPGDGLIETKCPTTTTFIRWVMNGVVPPEHKPQMLAQLSCTGRKWVDFVAFDPRVKRGERLFIRRFEPEEAEIEVVESEAIKFLKELDAMFDLVTKAEQ